MTPLRARAWLLCAAVLRRIYGLSRPRRGSNAARLRAQGESLEGITLRDATTADIPALAALHVELWNRTYRTSRGPSVATRTRQWQQKLAATERRDFLLLMENGAGELIGFAWGLPYDGAWDGELSKIYLSWEYHGLGLGRRLLEESARRFAERGMHSFILFAELTNPTLGFYDRMGGTRLLDDQGVFNGAYGWSCSSSGLHDSE